MGAIKLNISKTGNSQKTNIFLFTHIPDTFKSKEAWIFKFSLQFRSQNMRIQHDKMWLSKSPTLRSYSSRVSKTNELESIV